MAFPMASSRSKRYVRKKIIYSPSDPLEPDYYLIYVEEINRDFIVIKSSIKQQSNGQVLLSMEGKEKQGVTITAGKLVVYVVVDCKG